MLARPARMVLSEMTNTNTNASCAMPSKPMMARKEDICADPSLLPENLRGRKQPISSRAPTAAPALKSSVAVPSSKATAAAAATAAGTTKASLAPRERTTASSRNALRVLKATGLIAASSAAVTVAPAPQASKVPSDFTAQQEQQEDEMADQMDVASSSASAAPTPAPTPIVDIDQYDANDPMFCVEYVQEIVAYLRRREIVDRVSSNYMDVQMELVPSFRAILVEWLAEISLRCRMLSETFLLAVNIVDRFLSVRAVARDRLQLVGSAALLVACKFEEIYAPRVSELVHLCENTYSANDMMRMERIILSTLQYNLGVATPLHFLRRYSKAAYSDPITHTLSKYLVELSATEYGMLVYLPSEIAAASVYVARNMRGISPLWNPVLEHYSAYTEEQVLACARDLTELVRVMELDSAQHNNPIRRKYKSDRCSAVARISYRPLPTPTTAAAGAAATNTNF